MTGISQRKTIGGGRPRRCGRRGNRKARCGSHALSHMGKQGGGDELHKAGWRLADLLERSLQ
jgi:hypothetical protein